MEPRANNLAEVDKLNIVYFGEMDISSEEKMLRVVMAAALQNILLKYYDTIRNVYVSFSRLGGAADALIASAAAEFAKNYMLLFTKYYPQYLSVLGVSDYSGISQWAQEHSRDLAAQIAVTDINGSGMLVYDRMLNTARTEANAIGNLAVLHAAHSAGKTRKRWKTFGDSRVRSTHREAAGQTVPINEPFIVGGSQLMFPCDTSLGASAAEVVNCRCTVQYL